MMALRFRLLVALLWLALGSGRRVAPYPSPIGFELDSERIRVAVASLPTIPPKPNFEVKLKQRIVKRFRPLLSEEGQKYLTKIADVLLAGLSWKLFQFAVKSMEAYFYNNHRILRNHLIKYFCVTGLTVIFWLSTIWLTCRWMERRSAYAEQRRRRALESGDWPRRARSDRTLSSSSDRILGSRLNTRRVTHNKLPSSVSYSHFQRTRADSHPQLLTPEEMRALRLPLARPPPAWKEWFLWIKETALPIVLDVVAICLSFSQIVGCLAFVYGMVLVQLPRAEHATIHGCVMYAGALVMVLLALLFSCWSMCDMVEKVPKLVALWRRFQDSADEEEVTSCTALER